MVLTAQRQRTKTITDYQQIEEKITDYRQEKYQADLATKRERHLTTRKRAERTNSTSGAELAELDIDKGGR